MQLLIRRRLKETTLPIILVSQKLKEANQASMSLKCHEKNLTCSLASTWSSMVESSALTRACRSSIVSWHTHRHSHTHTQMLNFAFPLPQQESDLWHHCHFSSDTRQESDEHRHSGVSVLPSDWLLVHQCSKVPAKINTNLNKPPTRLRLFSFCPSCTAMLMLMIVKNALCNINNIVVNCSEKLVYLFVWSRANCNLQLCKTLLQLCNLQRRNRVNNNAPSDPHTHVLTHLSCFASLH